MDKRYLHHLWTRIRPIKAWYLFAAFVVTLGIHIAALRSNNIGMVELREAVYLADKDGGNVEQALQDLRSYVGSHMNTDLDNENGVYPPIQLKYTYERLIKSERERVDTVNSQVYIEAQGHCEALYPDSFSGGPRVPCIEQYVKANGTSAQSVADAQYKFDFVSPSWSPDLAGWTRVIGVFLLALTIIRFGMGKWLKTTTE